MSHTSAPTPSLLPQPARSQLREEELVLTPQTAVLAPSALAAEAGYLTEILRGSTGWPIPVVNQKEGHEGPLLVLETEETWSHLGPEGYHLAVTPQGVTLSAAQSAGIFYGIQTLLQLLPPAIFGAGPHSREAEPRWALPCGKFEDQPKYAWRGVMLDCVRHFRPVAFVKKMIRLAALHKLNTFHWHLTDDQGWRIEIKKYPRLTEIGAWRKETRRGHFLADGTGDGLPHGGFYTQDEIREVVAFAAAHHVTIVPEIEMPGHAQAAVAAYPELGCTSEPVEVRTSWGISADIYNPEESTLLFLQDVLTEVMELFPGRTIHVGGDEARKDQWLASPEVQQRITTLGLKDVHEMQSYFIRRMEEFLAAHGRRLIGWDEILEGGLAPGAAVMSWRGTEGGQTAARLGHDVVMTPQQSTYLDFYQSAEVLDEPLAIGHLTRLEDVFAYDPLPADLPPEKAHHILGTQAQLWGEFMPTTEHVEYMAFPRLAALAEVAWTAERDDFAGFRARLKRHLKRLDILGVRYRPLDDDDRY